MADVPPTTTGSEASPSLPMPSSMDRAELISRARTFLTSHQVQNQDIFAKRRFLSEKGLSESEVDSLLRELPHQLPMVPPRTYPSLPPSALPALISGILRAFGWLLGGSTVLVLLYHRFLLPRITRTAVARQSITSHHLSLMRKLTTNLAALKESQSESYSILPRPEPYKEPAELAQCASIDAILKRNLSPAEIHPITLLRCAISDFTKLHKDEAPTTEELFQIMEAKLPELASESGADMENALWDTLTTCPFFTGSQEDSNTPSPAPRQTRWTYNPPTPQAPTPMQASLHSLSTAMPQKGKSEPTSTVRQHALQALTNLTGYISTQVYLPYRPPGINTSLGPAEDEMRREIRALKGLVLNRRSFMPSLPRANTINGVQC